MTVHVEPVGIDRVGELAALWVDLADGQRAHGSHLRAAENREAVREALAHHAVTGGLLVAREDDETLGFATTRPETGGYDLDVDRGTVENLYVVPGRRGEGVGARLLSAAETRLREAGCEAVSLEVMADNDGARRFYRRHGYDPHRIELEKRLGTDTDTNPDD